MLFRSFKHRGRWFAHFPNHPSATKEGYVARSRLIVEGKIRRFLTSEEIVHHINGITDDDKPENLMLMSTGEHLRLQRMIKNGIFMYTQRWKKEFVFV